MEGFLELPIPAPVSSSVPELELAKRALVAAETALVNVPRDDEMAHCAAVADVESAEREVRRLERVTLATARARDLDDERFGVIGLPGGES